ncbi:uncharacterized protein LOC131657663 [Vicia villosa]|uniref:uncharacterized protein LOC131657663 n=1 Tax=Vicia villosa TaxID=3911 RepID=UPI00273BB4BB|nr:uncharacterized protein LOC131657663 [Vicia villosa]
MRVFGAQDVLDLDTDGYVPVVADATEAQRKTQRELMKKDQKALFYIHQCVDASVFEKIVDSTTEKAAWDILARCYGSDTSLKKVKFQSLCKQYENLNMKNNEKVPVYISRVILITNKMKACRERLSEHVIIENILRSLTPQFGFIFVEIKHSKNLKTMRIEELQRKAKKRHCGGYHKLKAFNSDEKKHHKGNDKLDKRKVKCYNCNRFGHFAKDYWSNKERKSEEANIVKRNADDEPMLLMDFESDGGYWVGLWYMDTGFLNPLSENKQWLIDFNSRKRKKIICPYDKYLNVEGMRNVKVKVKNGKIVIIKDV